MSASSEINHSLNGGVKNEKQNFKPWIKFVNGTYNDDTDGIYKGGGVEFNPHRWLFSFYFGRGERGK